MKIFEAVYLEKGAKSMDHLMESYYFKNEFFCMKIQYKFDREHREADDYESFFIADTGIVDLEDLEEDLYSGENDEYGVYLPYLKEQCVTRLGGLLFIKLFFDEVRY